MDWQPRPILEAPLLNVMNFLNEVTLWYPDAISFAPGRPAEQFFDVQGSLATFAGYIADIASETHQTPETVFNQCGQYQKTNGVINDLIRQFLANDEQINVPANAIMVTNGCQEAMLIVLASLCEPGRDVLLVSDPTYIGITGVASILGVEVCAVQSTPTGLNLHDLAQSIAALRSRDKNPKALYVIPDFNNPLGTSMELDQRRQLLDMAYDEQFLIIEDNAYGMFAYDEQPMPTLKSLDQTRQVIYLGTFSKTLYPGLRVGFLVADQEYRDSGTQPPRPLLQEMSKVKSMTTVTTSPLLQGIIGGILLETGCSLRDRVEDKRVFYQANRDHMLACLERNFAPDALLSDLVSWNSPKGGFFLTVTLPFAFDEQALRRCASEYGVICCPMSYFSLTPGRDNQIRLSFSYVSLEQITQGIQQLYKFVLSNYSHGTAVMNS